MNFKAFHRMAFWLSPHVYTHTHTIAHAHTIAYAHTHTYRSSQPLTPSITTPSHTYTHAHYTYVTRAFHTLAGAFFPCLENTFLLLYLINSSSLGIHL